MDKQYSSEAEFDLQTDVQEPLNYKVVLLNDDYTTKDFVVEILTRIFHKPAEEAVLLMETVHVRGEAVVGVYTYDVAATRVMLTIQLARKNGFPLRCELREA